jgi:hypothetical protein
MLLSAVSALSCDISLELSHPLGATEKAWIEVQVGQISRGQEVIVETAAGEALGVISPFGIRTGRDAGTYTLPVPESYIRNGRIEICVKITQPAGSPRPPTATEVRGVKLVVG